MVGTGPGHALMAKVISLHLQTYMLKIINQTHLEDQLKTF